MKTKTQFPSVASRFTPEFGALDDSLVRWAVQQCASTAEALGALRDFPFAEVAPDEMWPLIQARAYELFAAGGSVPGHALSDWLRAEKEIHEHFDAQAHESEDSFVPFPRPASSRVLSARAPFPPPDEAFHFSQI